MANSPLLLPDAEQRAWRYWFADGLAHIVFGTYLLAFAFAILYTPHGKTLWLSVAWLAALAVMFVVPLRYHNIVEWLKTKTTYRRTGYVRVPVPEDSTNLVTLSLHETHPLKPSFQISALVGSLFGDMSSLSPSWASAYLPEEAHRLQATGKKRQLIALVLFTLAFACLLTTSIESIANLCVCGAGILAGAAAWVVRKDYRLSWLIVLGFPVIGLCMTIFLATHIKGQERGTFFFGGWGTLFLLDGAITLIRYILRNPMPRAPTS